MAYGSLNNSNPPEISNVAPELDGQEDDGVRLTVEDKKWLVRLTLQAINTLIYALGDSQQVDRYQTGYKDRDELYERIANQ